MKLNFLFTLLLISLLNFSSTERVIAIGDIHGNYKNTIEILKMASIITNETSPSWTGKKTKLIQLGDILDRGPDSIAVLELFQNLKRDASKFGGEVIMLMGNHV